VPCARVHTCVVLLVALLYCCMPPASMPASAGSRPAEQQPSRARRGQLAAHASPPAHRACVVSLNPPSFRLRHGKSYPRRWLRGPPILSNCDIWHPIHTHALTHTHTLPPHLYRATMEAISFISMRARRSSSN
jgi:hypothetical protein